MKHRRGRALRRRYGRAGGEQYDVFRLSIYTPKKRHISGPHTLADATHEMDEWNKQTRQAFLEGRIMYDVPEYIMEKRS